MESSKDSKYARPKAFFRTAGPICFGIGAILVLIAVVDFFQAFGTMGETPTKFFLGFIGIPLIAAGGFMIYAGYLREITEYTADESSPAISTVAKSVREGWEDGAPKVNCSKCGMPNDEEAKFCDSCGTEIARPS